MSPADVHEAVADLRPRLRGVLHEFAFFVSLVPGVALVVAAPTGQARLAAGIFAGSVTAMFGASALYHRVSCPPARQRWLRRLDHAMIYLLIAGTYTPYGLLVLSGAGRIAVLGTVWTGVLVAIVLTFAWTDAPKWLPPVMGAGLGWFGIVALPELVDGVGVLGVTLLAAGGLFYTAGAVIYSRRRPDPFPAAFGYHEVFHALVVAGVACQYASVAFFVLPG